MLDVITRRKDEKFDREIYDRSVGEVVIQARNLENDQSEGHIPEYRRDRGDVIEKKTVYALKMNQGTGSGTRHQEQVARLGQNLNGKKIKRDEYTATLCLTPICNEKIKRRFTNQCNIPDKATKVSASEENWKAKRVRFKAPKRY